VSKFAVRLVNAGDGAGWLVTPGCESLCRGRPRTA